MSSDNPTSADNQQERLVPEIYRTTAPRGFITRLAGDRLIEPESSETIRKAPPRSMEDEDMAHAL
jgi:hypothetical protein